MKCIDLLYILILFRAYQVLCLTLTCLGMLDDKHKVELRLLEMSLVSC